MAKHTRVHLNTLSEVKGFETNPPTVNPAKRGDVEKLFVFLNCLPFLNCFEFYSCRRVGLDASLATPEDILAAEKFMRELVLDSPDKRNNNREEMLEKFVLTRESRRDFILKQKTAATTILIKNPRLKDMKEAVSFSLFIKVL